MSLFAKTSMNHFDLYMNTLAFWPTLYNLKTSEDNCDKTSSKKEKNKSLTISPPKFVLSVSTQALTLHFKHNKVP